MTPGYDTLSSIVPYNVNQGRMKLSSTISTYTTNWFKVTNLAYLEELIERTQMECFDSGEPMTLNHHQGKVRITAYDVIEQGFGFYDEDEDDFINFEDEIVAILADGEVFRLSTISWFKGRLEHASISVTTWDGRSAYGDLGSLGDELSAQLEIDRKVLSGWG